LKNAQPRRFFRDVWHEKHGGNEMLPARLGASAED
jgi:hypothetical protein